MSKIFNATKSLIWQCKKNVKLIKPESISAIVSAYRHLNEVERHNYLLHVSNAYQFDAKSISTEKLRQFELMEHDWEKINSLYQMRTRITPRYFEFLLLFGRVNDGIKFLVELRTDVLNIIGAKSQSNSCSSAVFAANQLDRTNLQIFDRELRNLLAIWFSTELCRLERVTWHTSSCQLVERVSALEAVHPIRNLIDIRSRLAAYRRCFVFFHPCIGGNEPIVILHTALHSRIAQRMTEIRDFKSDPNDVNTEQPEQIKAAIFYSITSPHKGLSGIDLGNHMIKSVVVELQRELPQLEVFATLSPIPGFRAWLDSFLTVKSPSSHSSPSLSSSSRPSLSSPLEQILSARDIAQLASLFNLDAQLAQQHNSAIQLELAAQLKSAFASIAAAPAEAAHTSASSFSPDTLEEVQQDEEDLQKHRVVRRILMRVCCRYLLFQKHRGHALNSVCNFHLSNGAVVWMLNWMGDPSARGISQSYGLMVNYRYFIEQTNENSEKYLLENEIKRSEHIEAILFEDDRN